MEINEQEPHKALPAVSTREECPQAEIMSRLSLLQLGYDILALIVEDLRISSPTTLASVALVCSQLQRLAQAAQHRELTLDLTGQYKLNIPWNQPTWSLDVNDKVKPVSPGVRLALNRIEARGLAPAIRHLRVRSDPYDDAEMEVEKPSLHGVLALLPLMTGLTDLTWTSRTCLPNEVTELLRSRPTLRLHIDFPGEAFYDPENGRKQRPRHEEAISSLTGLGNLTSLSVKHSLPMAGESRVMTPLKQVLLTCPNLCKLQLRMPKRRLPSMAYCSRTRPWRPYPEGYHGFGFVDGQRPAAALRELTLVNYRFGKREIPNDETSEPSSTIKKYPLPGLEEDYWADTFDWSQLEHLDIDNLKLAERIAPQLTSLRELVAVNLSHAMSYDENSIADLHTRVPARLESITVVSMKSVGLDGLQRHGSSLRKLQVHHEHSRDWHNSAIDQCTMQNIHDFCPNLEDLSIDVRRDGEWPYSTLDVIANFPRLRHLTIWFELGYNREVPIKPYVTASAAQHLFRYVWGKSPTQRSPLRTMTINSGSVPSGRRASDLETSQASHKSTTFVFTVSERDDGMPEGRYHLQVGGLPAADSAFLQEGSTVKEPRLDTKDWREYRLSLVKYGPKMAEDQGNN